MLAGFSVTRRPTFLNQGLDVENAEEQVKNQPGVEMQIIGRIFAVAAFDAAYTGGDKSGGSAGRGMDCTASRAIHREGHRYVQELAGKDRVVAQLVQGAAEKGVKGPVHKQHQRKEHIVLFGKGKPGKEPRYRKKQQERDRLTESRQVASPGEARQVFLAYVNLDPLHRDRLPRLPGIHVATPLMQGFLYSGLYLNLFVLYTR